jgi:uncharacterized membrane protein
VVGLGSETKEVYLTIADVFAFGQYSRSQLKFDISGIPHGADITSAKLWLYRLAADNWDGNITLHRVENQVWGEDITENEFDKQTLTNEENHVSKFMSHGWDNLDVLTQLEVDHDAGNPYTSFRLRWTGDNGGEPSAGVDDSPLLAIESEYDNLHIIFYSSEYGGREPYLEVTYIQPYAVSVSISPSYQSGPPGETLNYIVTIINGGSLSDNYDLTASDNSGWSPTLSENLLEIPAGENKQITLSVTVPANALGCTNDNVIITATSRADNTASGNDSCIAHAEIVRDVQVLISPSYQEDLPGETLIYDITVRNTGNIGDTYTLENSDNVGWSLSLENTSLAIPPFENGTTKLTVTIPENAIPCTNDNIRVIATSQENENVSAQDTCTAHAQAVRGVEVSIWPSYQSGTPGATINYTVMVKNTGNVKGDYGLENGDDLGWTLVLSQSLLENIQPNENKTVTLSVTIPYNAAGCTIDNVWVAATSTENENVRDNENCQAHAAVVRSVDASISPREDNGVPGTTLTYTITVKNTGNVLENYNLTAGDNENWGPSLSENRLKNVEPGENKDVTLSVTIPDNAVPCMVDNITITATSQADNTVSASASCIAHAIAAPQLPSQPQLSSPSDGSEVSTNTPTLRWENAMYAENHRVLLDDDSDPDDNPLHDHTVKGDNEWTTPALTEDETYYWKVIAQNENGENHSVTWDFTVNAEEPPPTNKPPTADADGPYSVQENGTVELDGTGSTDPDGDPLTYSWTIVDDPTGGASLTDDDTATPVFHAPEHVDNAVDVTVKLSVNDGHGHTGSDTATVTIQPAGVNLPPTADAGGPYSVQKNENIELDGTGSSDSDGTIVAYSWTITDDPTGEASLTDSDTATPVFHAPSVESDTEVTVELTVEDDDGATDTDTATVTVRVAGVGPSQYELSTLASPPEGGTVTLDPPGGTYEEGTEVTMTAEPAVNYEFDHWSGDASGTSTSVTITMDSDKVVAAHFRSSGEEGGGLPLVPLGLGIILLAIVTTTIIAMTAKRRRRSTRSPAKSS